MANVLERALRVGEGRLLRRLKNYADAVMACVKCLRARLPDLTGESALPAGDPVHCLSATTHSASGHRFWLKPGQRIESVFNGSIKRYCGEGGA